jgi:hypothetical protein
MKLDACQNNIKISFTCIEIVMPNFDPKHKVVFSVCGYTKRCRICSIDVGLISIDDNLLYSIHKSVRKYSKQTYDEKERYDSSEKRFVLWFRPVPEVFRCAKEVELSNSVFYYSHECHFWYFIEIMFLFIIFFFTTFHEFILNFRKGIEISLDPTLEIKESAY